MSRSDRDSYAATSPGWRMGTPSQPSIRWRSGHALWEFPCTSYFTKAKRRRRYQRTSGDRKSTRLNSSHLGISYAVFCLKKKKTHARTIHEAEDHTGAHRLVGDRVDEVEGTGRAIYAVGFVVDRLY